VDRFELAAQASDNALWDWDLTTNRIHFSPGWISMLGCSGVDFGNSLEEWFGRVHPEDLESVRREINDHLSQGSSQFESQHRLLHQDGCYRWVSCLGLITRDQNGRAIRVAGSHVDITPEKVVDALTGLPNRLLLLDRLKRSIDRAKKQEDFLFAVLIVDLNLFNSGISHLETVNTDSLVITAARRMETFLRAWDSSAQDGRAHLIARSVGEEFIILLDGLSALGEAKNTADKLLKEVLAPFDFNAREVFLSPDIGIALSATGYRNAEEALRDADTALYRAKSFGKSRCEVFDTAVLESTRSRSQLGKELQEALARNQFQVFYQPVVSLSVNQIVGFEALTRWIHPSRGLVMPMEFIGIAQKTGLIVELDRWVLQEACKQVSTWKKHARISKDLWVSVNLSSAQFTQPSLMKEIGGVLRNNELDASSLMLELTEGTVMENPESARSLLMQLRVMGARIGLDDFGTGYSSLAHLRRFPLDFLKIDHTFVRSIENNSDTLEIIRAINVLARQLGLHVVAEGIENSRQLEILQSLGCEYGQGFLFSRAVPAEKAEKLMLEGFGPSAKAGEPGTDCLKDVGDSVESISEQSSSLEGKGNLTQGMKYLLVGIAALVLLTVGILAAKMSRVRPLPAGQSSPAPAALNQTKPLGQRAAPVVEQAIVPEIKKEPEIIPDPKGAAAAVIETKLHPEPEASASVGSKKASVPATAKGTASVPSSVIRKKALAKMEQKNPAVDVRARSTAVTIESAAQQNEPVAPPAPVESVSAMPPKLPEEMPGHPPRKAPAVVHQFPVLHSHVLGSCRGVLKFTRESVSFVSVKEKDSFYFEYPGYTVALERDQLTIKAGSMAFRFKSDLAISKEDNRSQLSEIYQKISKLHADAQHNKQ
jgi:diguanylate cyclase (GGDEF)-like protein/PAS domain S-box-containing protein